MKQHDFIEASTYLRVLEKRLLTSSGLERAVDAPDLLETFKIISQDCGYDFSGLSRPEDYETVLKSELANLYSLLRKLAGESVLVDIASLKYDFHNMKVALKRKYRGETSESPYIDVTALAPSDIELYLTGAPVENFPGFAASALKAAEAKYLGTSNPQDIDLILDRLLFSRMLSLAEELGNEFILNYARTSADFFNAKTFFRAREMRKGLSFLTECLAEGGNVPSSFYKDNYNKDPGALADSFYYKHPAGDMVRSGIEGYERAGTFSELERLFDNALMERVRTSKYVAFGPWNLFSYLMAKENEIRQIRILAVCKLNKIDPALIRERLRDNYA